MTHVPVYNSRGDKKIGYVVREKPICGEDFCETCGDCLHCYGDTECTSAVHGKHSWFYYEQNLPEGATLIKGCQQTTV